MLGVTVFQEISSQIVKYININAEAMRPRGLLFMLFEIFIYQIYSCISEVLLSTPKYSESLEDNVKIIIDKMTPTLYVCKPNVLLCCQSRYQIYIYLAPGGGCEVLFSPGLSVCVCVCVCVCPANIFVFYFSAIRRDIDLKFVKVTGTVHCFLKVQSYHKN